MKVDRCPVCLRGFDGILDYPKVRVLSFTRLPIPEAVDTMSEAAAEKRLARRKRESRDATSWVDDGINMTPDIERAVAGSGIRNYFESLDSAIGKELSPNQLLPPFKPDRYFKRAFPIPESTLFLSLHESDKHLPDGRITEIHVLCHGPNMGSAGGPTLLLLGSIAELHYAGLFAGPCAD